MSFFNQSSRRDDVEGFYRSFAPALLLYARVVLKNRDQAEDLIQQLFLKLLNGKMLPSTPKAYLFRAVRNAALNANRTPVHEPIENFDPMFVPAGASSIALEQALDALPEEQRQIVVMRIWGQMTLAEAAEVLDISVNTAASRYRYALTKMREKLTLRSEEVNNARP